MDGACSSYERDEKCIENFSYKIRRKTFRETKI